MGMGDVALVAFDGYVEPWGDLEAFAQAVYAGAPVAPGDLAVALERGATNPRRVAQMVEDLVRRSLDATTLAQARAGMVVCTARDTVPLTLAALSAAAWAQTFSTGRLGEALAVARAWLCEGAVDWVVVTGVDDLAAGAFLLAPMRAVPTDAQDGVDSVIAVLEYVGHVAVGRDDVGLSPDAIGYLESDEIPLSEALIRAYAPGDAPDLTCAVSSLSLPSGVRSPIAALLKLLLALYRRFLPSVPGWVEGANRVIAGGGPFYAEMASRAWFGRSGVARRAALHVRDGAQTTHVIWAEAAPTRHAYPPVLPQTGGATAYLMPIAGHNQAEILAYLDNLAGWLEDGVSLDAAGRRAYTDYRAAEAAPYALALVGRHREEMLKQLDLARTGVVRAFTKERDWQTPRGSAFSPQPLGERGVAFVYPGAFNAYVGLGRDLFQHLPGLHEHFDRLLSDLDHSLATHLLYPRGRRPLSADDLQDASERLRSDPASMIEAGMAFSIAYTSILTDLCGVKPDQALGYSLGEASMLWGLGVWEDGDGGSEKLHGSTLFSSRIFGPKQAVRDHWGRSSGDDDFWAIHLLKAPVDQVRACVAREPHVYLTIVNLVDEVVIAGERDGCDRVIEALGCHALPALAGVVIHNEAMRSEYEIFRDIYSYPVVRQPDVTFYSAADYAPLRVEQESLADELARMCCAPVDFPRLVEGVYQDGGRIFVELGPMGTCTRWIQRILRGKPNTAVAINGTGTSDFEGVLAVLARLIAHRVPVDLAPFFADVAPVRVPVRLQLSSPPSSQAVPSTRPASPDSAPVEPAPVVPGVRAGSLPGGQLLPASVTAGPDTDVVGAYERHLLPHRERAVQAHRAFLDGRRVAQTEISTLIEMQLSIGRRLVGAPATALDVCVTPPEMGDAPPLFDAQDLRAFALGDPVQCFGPSFAVYGGRRLPRIPNGPLLFLSRVVAIQGEPGHFTGEPSLTSAYDVPEDVWYYEGDLYPGLPPYAILMEMALQPCGFLSAYLESSLLVPDADFHFRNLDGRGTVLADMDLRGRCVQDEVQLVSSTQGQGAIIQAFTYRLSCEGVPFYEGWASFGYFTAGALSRQIGLDKGARVEPWMASSYAKGQPGMVAASIDSCDVDLRVPHRLRLVEDIVMAPEGGRYGAGYLHARVPVSPSDWFFQAHFYQDPVMPGSLGIEAACQAVFQALSAYARCVYPHWRQGRLRQVPAQTVVWKYRGQVTQSDRDLTLEVHVSQVRVDENGVTFVGDASVWLGDVRIYAVEGLALRLESV